MILLFFCYICILYIIANNKTIDMKRCDNCGWYNPDTAQKCEKCGEKLPEFTEPERQESPAEPAAPDFTPAHPLAQTEPRPVPGERRRPRSQGNYAATMLNAGVAFDAPEAASAAPGVCPKCHYPIAGNPETCPNCGASLRRNTRQDASHASSQPVQPEPAPQPVQPRQNQMMSTIRDGSPQAARAKAAPAPAAAYGKATIRDVPRYLRQEEPAAPAPEPAPAPRPEPAPAPAPEPAPAAPATPSHTTAEPEKVDITFRLVPISDPDSRIIYMRVGDLVTIEGKLYRIVQ